MPFPRHTLADADRLVAAAGFASTSVDAAERCTACRRYTRRKIVDGVFYCPAHAREAIVVARRIAEVEAIADAAEPEVAEEPVQITEEQPAEVPSLVERVAAVLDATIVPIASVRPYGEGCALVTIGDRVIGDPQRYADTGSITGRHYSARSALARAGYRETASGGTQIVVEEPAGLVHLMSDDLLDACGTAGPGGLVLMPSSRLDEVTCPRCLLLAVDEEVQRLGYTSAARYLDARPELRDRVEVAADAPDSTAPIADAAEPEVVEEPATVERYRAPSGNRDEDRFRAVHTACGWRSPAWHSNRTVEGRRLAERDAQQHRCPELVEADVPPTDEERVTVPIRARELRPGDLVVDSLGRHQYAAFDTDAPATPGNPQQVLVWTAIRDQENGLPPVIRLRPEQELLVLRPMSTEGREIAAAAGWLSDCPATDPEGWHCVERAPGHVTHRPAAGQPWTRAEWERVVGMPWAEYERAMFDGI